MNLEKWLTDPVLCLVSIFFLILWAFLKHKGQIQHQKAPQRIEIFMVTLFRFLCGVLLVYASLDKLGDPGKFSESIENYQLLSKNLIPLAAVVIPWLEFFTGLCLVAGFKSRGAALNFCLLMALYTFALAWDLSHDIDINCSCFSMDTTEKITWLSVIRDLLFFFIGFIVLTSPSTYASLDRLNGQKTASRP